MTERILIVDDDIDTLRLVGVMLQRQGYETIAAFNGTQGLEKAFAEKPDLILLDVMMPDMDGYEVTRRLRKNPATSSTPILMFTAKTQLDDKVTGFEVGADDYLTKPTHPTELQSHVRALLARVTPSKTDELKQLSPNQNGFVVGIISARGGVGVSTVAANIAAALLNRTQTETILAELTPGHGTLGIDLGMPGQKGLTEILQGQHMGITKEKVQSSLVQHSSGLKLLIASENPRDVNLASQVQNFETLVSRLTSLARFVVLDLGAGLPTYAQKMLSASNLSLVVLEGTASAIQQTKLLIDEIMALKIKKEKIAVLLNNRQRSEAQMPAAKVQATLEYAISAALTPSPEVFLQAARVHAPVVISQPSSMATQQFLKIADEIIKREKAR